MNLDDEPAALMALLKKYKPSPSDFLLARVSARLEIIETLLIGVAHPHDAKMRLALGEKTTSDVLEATENHLRFLCQSKGGGGGGGTVTGNN